MTFEEALQALIDRYGGKKVRHHPNTGDVVIELPISPGSDLLWPHIFTWQQAKYLAKHPMPDDDIVGERLPAGFPR